MVQEKKREPDAREEDEERRREDENRDGEKARRGEKRASHDSTAAENARDVHRETRSVAGPLSIVPFDLAPEVAQDESTGGHDQETEEADPVRKSSA
jgi:hypothetical protein